MSESLCKAAESLLKSVSAPKGSLNVIPYRDNAGEHLLVWLDERNPEVRQQIPSEFEGYDVLIEKRPNATTY